MFVKLLKSVQKAQELGCLHIIKLRTHLKSVPTRHQGMSKATCVQYGNSWRLEVHVLYNGQSCENSKNLYIASCNISLKPKVNRIQKCCNSRFSLLFLSSVLQYLFIFCAFVCVCVRAWCMCFFCFVLFLFFGRVSFSSSFYFSFFWHPGGW